MDEWEGLGRRDQRTMSLGWGLGATELFFSLWFYLGGCENSSITPQRPQGSRDSFVSEHQPPPTQDYLGV